MLPEHFQSATRLARDLRSGRLRARDLLERYLARVDAINPSLNAIVVDDRETARRDADAADAALACGEVLGPLHGVPMTVKESYDLRGHPTTFGDPALADHRASADAVTVGRLKRAGAVVFGKTNVPVALADFQSYNDVYGVTGNPWDPARTPGGSSGGSAAALAAGLTGLELGSDIGGSIRNPAHFCGVFGHKPTYDLVPPRGHTVHEVLSFPDLAVVGPLARSAGDLETALRVLAGPDAIEARGLRLRLPTLTEPTSALRIAVWADDSRCPVSAAVRERLDAVVAALETAGARVDRAVRPDFDPVQYDATYRDLLQAAMAADLPDAMFDRAMQRAATLSPDDTSALARVTRAQTMRRRDWARLNESRTALRWTWRRFFDTVDFVIAPIMPVTAFPHDHGPLGRRTLDIDGRAQPYFDVVFWAGLATLAYLPATVLPAGPARDGLPVGVQIIGPAYGDLRCIQLAQRLESMGFGFVPPPSLAR